MMYDERCYGPSVTHNLGAMSKTKLKKESVEESFERGKAVGFDNGFESAKNRYVAKIDILRAIHEKDIISERKGTLSVGIMLGATLLALFIIVIHFFSTK